MFELENICLHGVSGGSVIRGLIIGGEIYVNASELFNETFLQQVMDATEQYNKLGRAIGAQTFEMLHPNTLGQMVYTRTDI